MRKRNMTFEEFVDNLTGWRLIKGSIKLGLLLIICGTAAGLLVGVPCWLLYKLFFVVLP